MYVVNGNDLHFHIKYIPVNAWVKPTTTIRMTFIVVWYIVKMLPSHRGFMNLDRPCFFAFLRTVKYDECEKEKNVALIAFEPVQSRKCLDAFQKKLNAWFFSHLWIITDNLDNMQALT